MVRLRVIKTTKNYIVVDVTPLFKDKKKIPKYLGIKNIENIKFE